MGNFTFEEINLLCIYNPGTREGAIEALSEMRGYLEPDETELLALTDSTLAKLRARVLSVRASSSVSSGESSRRISVRASMAPRRVPGL